ncbi:hypothetical protein ACJX0J_021016, partial [Zea mays]
EAMSLAALMGFLWQATQLAAPAKSILFKENIEKQDNLEDAIRTLLWGGVIIALKAL